MSDRRARIYFLFLLSLLIPGCAPHIKIPINGPLCHFALSAVTFNVVSAGKAHACAIDRNTGQLYCWGSNQFGQLGLGNQTLQTCASNIPCQPFPAPVSQGVVFTSVSAGQDFTCALDNSNNAYCWGHNNVGQLGNGTMTDSNVPVRVSGNHKFQAISSGGDHACAIDTLLGPSGGHAWCWGQNASGQLGSALSATATCGRPFTSCNSVPLQQGTGLTAGSFIFRSISAGFNHTCAIGGTLDCWGDNSSGELGNGQTSAGANPDAVSPGAFRQVSAGLAYTCAVTPATGTSTPNAAQCWGTNTFGQLGNGNQTQNPSPTPVMGSFASFVYVTTGFSHTCAMAQPQAQQASIGVCWGDNSAGQLGIGSTSPVGTAISPTPVVGPISFVSPGGLATGLNFTCGIDMSNRLACWGDNSLGQLALPLTTTSANTPQVGPIILTTREVCVKF